MKRPDELYRELGDWLSDGPTVVADRVIDHALEAIDHIPQRRRPLVPWRFPTMPFSNRLALVATLVIAAFGTTMMVSTAPPPSPGTSAAPIPSGDAAVLVVDKQVYGSQDGDIYTVRADGTDVRQLTSGPDAELAPSWSPDGTRIAYRLSRDGTSVVAVMDAGGGNRTTLATTGPNSPDCVEERPVWSPDGTAVVYRDRTSADCDGPYDLFIVATDASSPAARLLAPGMNSRFAAWSPDGTRIAFVGLEATGDTGLFVVDVGTGDALAGGLQARRITEAGTSLEWSAPRWSPDGTEIAAAAGTNGGCSPSDVGTMDIVIVNADGSGQRALVAETAKEHRPTWSPDGQQLAFLRYVDPSEWVLGRPCTAATWVIDADGTDERRLDVLGDTGGPDDQPPAWSPDGTRLLSLVVERIDGRDHFDVQIVTIDGSRPVVTIDDVWTHASWQPVAAPLPPAPSFAAASPTS